VGLIAGDAAQQLIAELVELSHMLQTLLLRCERRHGTRAFELDARSL
jgi:hypothetical protein